MASERKVQEKKLSIFEKYLTGWVALCIIVGIFIGRAFPSFSIWLDKMSIAQVSIPIAICLFFMMYPIMVKIDFSQVIKTGKTPKPVLLTLFVNWAIKPFSMFFIASFFLGFLFRPLIPGTEIIRGQEVPLYRSYVSGAILLGIAPCTAMVLMWSYLARGNDGLTLIMVAINSLTMLFLYAPLGGFLLGVNRMPIPWQTIVLSVLIYVGLPLLAGYFSRKQIIKKKSREWAAMIGASNHFEVAIATSTMLFGLASGSSLATVVGVLAEVPIMLMLVKICLATRNWFKR